MDGSWFLDKNFNGVPDEFFDDVIKLFDFPLEDVEPHEKGEDLETQFQHLNPPPSKVLVGIAHGIRGENSCGSLNIKKSLSISLSTDEACIRKSVPLHCDSLEGKYFHRFQVSSPVSVLGGSSSSCSVENPTPNFPRFVMPVKRPRSKRPRSQRHTFSFISSYASKRFHPLSAYESEPYIDEKILKKRMLLSCRVKIKKPSTQLPVETRKCNHCGVAKTPQWREGPMGPKTLCNACGVRYRSGRLLPEYRPAASPTFVPSLHSNSHRKVLEMRKTATQVTPSTAIDASMPTAPE